MGEFPACLRVRTQTTVKEPVTVEPTAEDLETWLEHQAGQLGTPTWWRELEAVPDIEDPCKFARKILGLFLHSQSPIQDEPGSAIFCTSSPQEPQQRSFLSQRTEISGCQTTTYSPDRGILPMFTTLGREM